MLAIIPLFHAGCTQVQTLPTEASSVPVTKTQFQTMPVGQDRAVFPYRQGELTLRNDSKNVWNIISIRESTGGPTFIVQAVVNPASSRTIKVALPAISAHQDYTITPLGANETLTAGIDWPVELVTADEFINPQLYRPWEGDYPSWPAIVRIKAIIVAATFALAIVALLLVRSARRRAVGVAIIVACGLLAAWLIPFMDTQDVVVREISNNDSTSQAATSPAGEKLLVVTARRQGQIVFPAGRWVPVYYSKSQWQRETLTIGDERLEATITPGEIRIFRGR